MAKRELFVADFETTTNPDDCRVWGYGITNIDDIDAVSIGNNIEDFIRSISRRNCIVYFHNLKFDGGFIVDWLFRNKFKHVEKYPRMGEFTTLISNMGAWYTFTVMWRNGVRTEFRDSMKKLPMSVERIAKSFKLEEAKGEIDYNKNRPIGYKITDEEKDYIRRDVQIVARALAIQLVEGGSKLTVGSDALSEYKKITTKKYFEKLFPVLPLDIDAEIRGAYRGGWTYVEHDRKGTIQNGGYVYDVNSLYPSVMYNRTLPYGIPQWFNGEPLESDDLWISTITFTAKLKENHLPCIQVKGRSHFIETEYVSEINEPVTLTVTSVDWELWNEHYDIDVMVWENTYVFSAMTGMFCEYIDKWMEIKERESGGLREIAKLFMNSLYGKFATNPSVTGKVPIFEDNKVRLIAGPEEMRNPVYTAMGAFITAYARDVTIRAAQSHYKYFAYADTDSLHLIMPEEPRDLDIHNTRLGAWKREYGFARAIYARAKAYSEELDDESYRVRVEKTGDPHAPKYETRIAGLPRPIAETLTIEDFNNGRVFHGKLVPRYVPGGIVLRDVAYTMKM